MSYLILYNLMKQKCRSDIVNIMKINKQNIDQEHICCSLGNDSKSKKEPK